MTGRTVSAPHAGYGFEWRATLCYMEKITHREMRNRSGEILRRVEAGESIEISNNGRPAAIIIPVGGNVLDGLIARGEARPARVGVEALSAIAPAVSTVTARELIEDSRGQW
jgi:prevent-host-death family protein